MGLGINVITPKVKPIAKVKEQQAVDFDRPSTAVDDFLESLLAPVDEYRPQQEILLPKVRMPVIEESVAKVPVATEQPDTAVPPPVENTALPEYFDRPFQCLLFKAAGSDFAVPLVSLSGIIKWDGKAGKLPGQPAWHRGVMSYRDGKMALVDLSSLLKMEKASESKSGFILTIDNGRFGLICDAVYRPLTLEKEQVKWRPKRVDRRWMLGTLREQLCPLVDMEALAKMLC